MKDWSIDKARDFYNIREWGQGYFDINSKGAVVVKPCADSEVDMSMLVDEIKKAGLRLPVLVRFDNILHDRVQAMQIAFAKARETYHYQSRYIAVYPIKVNQQRRVVEEILHAGNDQVGLESGSKAELMAVLGLLTKPHSTIICNGYKDDEYIRLALMARQLGHQVYIIIEKLSELSRIITQSKQLDIMPLLGVRVRLSSIGKGKWQNSGGEKSKFGLTAEQVLLALEQLRNAGLSDCLQLLHCHMGSQVSNIQDLNLGFREIARFYAELWRMGHRIHYVDVGGGLGVDYEGTRSRTFCSINYDLQEYANLVTNAFADACLRDGNPHPVLLTEAGRAMSAHHAVLITEVIETEVRDANTLPVMPTVKDAHVIHELWQVNQNLCARNVIETYHRVCSTFAEVQSLFVHGVLDIGARAYAESIYTSVCQRIRELLDPSAKAHREILDELNTNLADKVFCNFSLFQSIPDVWAINQIFPILPLSGLEQAPTRRAVVQDITCDSDGRIDNYVDGQGLEATLPLPSGVKYLGIFLTGAYQEILGDMHNLFGDTDSVHVFCNDDNSHTLRECIHGDSISDLLSLVNYDVQHLCQQYNSMCEQAGVDAGRRENMLSELMHQLKGYSYLA